jgi:AraC-like DNA-binding protein
MIENAADLARRWQALPASEKRAILHAIIARIDVRPETVDVATRPVLLPAVVKPDLDIRRLPETPEGAIQVLSVPVRLRRTGLETKLLIQGTLGAEPTRRTDRSLLRLIAMARRFNELVMAGAGQTVTELATEAGVSRSYFSRVLKLSFLAPEITKAIVQGRQPVAFSAIKLMRAGRFEEAWSDQRRQLGFN